MRKEKRYGPAVPEFEGPYAVAPVLDDVFSSHPPDARRGFVARRSSRDRRMAGGAGDARAPRSSGARVRLQVERPRGRVREVEGASAARLGLFAMVSRGAGPVPCVLRREVRIRAPIDGLHRLLNEAWRIGFVDGWRYGAAIHAEWAYRQGYAEGFDAGVREAGTVEFPYAYERAYNQAYAKWFDHWSRTAYPGLGRVRLDRRERRRDLRARRARVDRGRGRQLRRGIRHVRPRRVGKGRDGIRDRKVRLVGRGRMPESQKLSVQIADDVAPRTSSNVIVSLGDAKFETPLWISRPFEVADAPTIAADRLEGRVTLSLSVQNTSRRDADAVVRIDPLTGVGDSKREDVGIVPSGGSKRATHDVPRNPPARFDRSGVAVAHLDRARGPDRRHARGSPGAGRHRSFEPRPPGLHDRAGSHAERQPQ